MSLFERVSEDFSHIKTTGKRLSSLTHWRYYFAFSSPQNVLPLEFFDELFVQASIPEKQQQLSENMLSQINSEGSMTGTWFEHILSRLTPRLIQDRYFDECAGLVSFFFNYTDTVSARFRARNTWFFLRKTGINQVVRHLLKHMLDIDKARTIALMDTLVTNGDSPFWLADFMRELIWEHGLAQNAASPLSERLLSRDNTEQLRDRFADRMNQQEMRSQLLSHQSLLSYLYAWKEMSAIEAVKEWVREVSSSEQGLFDLLMRLRTTVFSSDRGAYLRINREQVSPFFDDWQSIEQKVRAKISGNELTPEMEELKNAMDNDD